MGRRPIPPGARCSAAPDCPHRVVAAGLCRRHYNEMYRKIYRASGSRVPKHLRTVGISAAHYRCKALWGPAKRYECVACGNPAAEWAYDGTDPTQRLERVSFYSTYPEFYMPMCKGCHSKMDGKRRQDDLLSYRRSFATGGQDRSNEHIQQPPNL